MGTLNAHLKEVLYVFKESGQWQKVGWFPTIFMRAIQGLKWIPERVRGVIKIDDLYTFTRISKANPRSPLCQNRNPDTSSTLTTLQPVPYPTITVLLLPTTVDARCQRSVYAEWKFRYSPKTTEKQKREYISRISFPKAIRLAFLRFEEIHIINPYSVYSIRSILVKVKGPEQRNAGKWSAHTVLQPK